MAGALPLWAGSGGSSRALLLSAELFRSAREAPAAGRGCSRCRGDAPSLSPSPGVGGPASAGSKALSSAEKEKGVSRAVDTGKRVQGQNEEILPLPECCHHCWGSAMLTPRPPNSGRLWCKVQSDSHGQALVCGRGERNPLTFSGGQSRGHWAAGRWMEVFTAPSLGAAAGTRG